MSLAQIRIKIKINFVKPDLISVKSEEPTTTSTTKGKQATTNQVTPNSTICVLEERTPLTNGPS